MLKLKRHCEWMERDLEESYSTRRSFRLGRCVEEDDSDREDDSKKSVEEPSYFKGKTL